MSLAVARPLSYFYWSNIRKDTILWSFLLVGLCLTFLPTKEIIIWLSSERMVSMLPVVVTKYALPALGFTLAMQWFCWASDVDFLGKASCLPEYFYTLPIRTLPLAAIPMLGGIVIILVSWLQWQTQELVSHRINLSVISAATFIWTQAILWQPMPLRGVRIPLIILVGFVFVYTAFSWNSEMLARYQNLDPVPLSAIIIYGLIGIIYSIWTASQARHSEGASLTLRILKRKIAENTYKFSSAIKAHSNYERKIHRLSLPIVFLVLSIIPLFFLLGENGKFYPDYFFFETTILVQLLIPIALAFISGLDRGSLALEKSITNRKSFSSYFSTLPMSSCDFVKAKMLMSAKNCLIVYSVFILFSFYSYNAHFIYDSSIEVRDILNDNNHGSPFSFVFNVLSNRFSSLSAMLILASTTSLSIGIVVLAQLAAIGIGLVVGLSRLPKFSTFLCGFTAVGILFYAAYEWALPTVKEVVTTEFGLTKLIIYVLAALKLTMFAKLLAWFRQQGKPISFLSPLLTLWFVVISSMAYLGYQFAPSEYKSIGLLLSGSFAACPIVSVLLSFPALHRTRFN